MPVELADIVRRVSGTLAMEGLLPSQRRVLQDVVRCRTPALGGHLYECTCGRSRAVYHSCRNRHCPKCQGNDSERWLTDRRELLLPTSYGLATCTLPSELRSIAVRKQRTVYAVLVREAAGALVEVCRNRRLIGGTPAVMAVLHTWTRAMLYHPHVHLLFSAGGLSEDGLTWHMPRKRHWILPGYALAKVFRERVEAAFRKRGLYHLVPARVWRKRWVANVKSVGSGDMALVYLSRYVFRIAFTNSRLERFDGTTVTFTWTDSRTRSTRRETLPAGRFVRRFLQHVLPRGFVKVRYYGLWAQTRRGRLTAARAILERCLEALGKPPQPIGRAPRPPMPPLICPQCGAPYSNPPRIIQRTRPPP